MKKVCVFLVSLCVLSCGKPPQCPTISPHDQLERSTGFDSRVDADVARIFGNPPPFGRAPSGIKWCDDSQKLVFVKKRFTDDGDSSSTLWIWEMDGLRERPLALEKNLDVSEYAWLDSERLVVLTGTKLYIVNMDGQTHLLGDLGAPVEGLQVSPNGKQLAYAKDYNIWLFEMETGNEKPVTRDGNEDVYFGQRSWLEGEEFGAEDGLGWSPDGTTLWFTRVDERDVNKRNIVVDENGSIRTQAYPHPGQDNPLVSVWTAQVEEDVQAPIPMRTDNGEDGYLPMVAWHPAGEHLYITRIDRLQTRLELLRCDANTGNCKSVFEHRDPRWVNFLGAPVFINNGKEFLWLSEKENFAHIYRYDEFGRLIEKVTDGSWVVQSIDGYDEASKRVFFTANVNAPWRYGVFSTSLGQREMIQHTPQGGVHVPSMSPDFTMFTDSHSSLAQVPRVSIFRIDGTQLHTLAVADAQAYLSTEVSNDVVSIETKDGETLYALITRPAVLSIEKKYPVLVYVYGGPGYQAVLDRFHPTYQAWRNFMAKKGVIVFTIDNRGSSGRGHEFEAGIHRQLTTIELEDQLAGIEYLKNQSYVDGDRIGIFGWSYGGTMALSAILRTEDTFRFGIAVAPVTDWAYYDSAYTERYMQRPSDNPQGYKSASLIGVAKNLQVPLLLIHGLADDNVHPLNSNNLVRKLIHENKVFETIFYPGKDHGLKGSKTRINLFTEITRFIDTHI